MNFNADFKGNVLEKIVLLTACTLFYLGLVFGLMGLGGYVSLMYMLNTKPEYEKYHEIGKESKKQYKAYNKLKNSKRRGKK